MGMWGKKKGGGEVGLWWCGGIQYNTFQVHMID